MADAVARAIERPGPPDRRGRHGRGQELRLPRAGDPGRRRAEEEGRRLDAHDRLQEQLLQQGHPVPAVGDAPGVLGRPGQGAGELHQPAPARRRASARAGATFQKQEEFDQLAEIRLWAGRTSDGTPVRPRLPAPAGSVWDAVAERERQLPGPRLPAAQGVLLLQGPAADVVGQHPGRQPRPVHERPGPAGGRLRAAARVRRGDLRRGPHARGRRRRAPGPAASRTSAVDYTLARLYNERTGKGLLAFHQLHEAMDQVAATPGSPPTTSSTTVADWQSRQSATSTAGSAGPDRCPTRSARSCASSATAIREGADQVEKPGAADRADRRRRRAALALADQLDDLAAPATGRGAVYWVELEEQARRRITPGLGPAATSARPCARCCSSRCPPAS